MQFMQSSIMAILEFKVARKFNKINSLGDQMKRQNRKYLITPTPASLKQAPTEMLIMMAADEAGLLSAAGIANIVAEIKSRNTQ